MNRLKNIHPGEVLQFEFLEPLNITPYRLAKAIGVQQTRIEAILDGKRAVTEDTAIRLGRYFSMTPQFWLNLQRMYDLEEKLNDPKCRAEYDRITPYADTQAAAHGN